MCLNEEKKSADRGGSRSVSGGLSVRGKGLTAWKGRGLAEGDFDAVNDVDGGGESSEGGFVRRGDYLHAGEVVNAILSVLVSYDAADGACLDDVVELESGRCIGGVAEVEVALGEGDDIVTGGGEGTQGEGQRHGPHHITNTVERCHKYDLLYFVVMSGGR